MDKTFWAHFFWGKEIVEKIRQIEAICVQNSKFWQSLKPCISGLPAFSKLPRVSNESLGYQLSFDVGRISVEGRGKVENSN